MMLRVVLLAAALTAGMAQAPDATSTWVRSLEHDPLAMPPGWDYQAPVRVTVATDVCDARCWVQDTLKQPAKASGKNRPYDM